LEWPLFDFLAVPWRQQLDPPPSGSVVLPSYSLPGVIWDATEFFIGFITWTPFFFSPFSFCPPILEYPGFKLRQTDSWAHFFTDLGMFDFGLLGLRSNCPLQTLPIVPFLGADRSVASLLLGKVSVNPEQHLPLVFAGSREQAFYFRFTPGPDRRFCRARVWLPSAFRAFCIRLSL